MSRAALAIHFVAGAALIAGWVLWWAPTALLWLAARVAVRARSTAEMAVADALAFVGCRRAARRLLARVIVRNRRKMRAAEARKRAARERRASSFTIS